MTSPTARQLQVLATIERLRDSRGFGPSIRELGELLDIHSTNGVNDHLEALRRKGLLVRHSRIARTWQATPLGLGFLGAP